MSQHDSTPDIPVVPQENWIDHEYLLHNEHVRVVGPNTVSISGPGIIKKILRPGHGDYPLPKALVNVHLVGKVQENGEIFQNSRNPEVQKDFFKTKQKITRDKQLDERSEKCQKELHLSRNNGADDVDLDVIRARQAKEETEALEQNDKADSEDTRSDLYIQQTSFQLGQKTVVRGLELAIASMKIGEIATISCRAEYAYSDIGIGDFIPDNAIIEYEVELLSSEASAIEVFPGVLKQFVKRGEGWSSPQYNTTCDVYIEGSYAIEDSSNPTDIDDEENITISSIGKYKTKQFLKRTEHPLQCRIDDILLPQGLEECLKTMKPGEIALFEVNKNILLGNGFEPKRHCTKLPIPSIPSTKDQSQDDDDSQYRDLVVYFYIELVELHHHIELWALPLEKRIQESERIKDVANEFLRLGLQNNQITDIPASYSMNAQLGHFSRAILRYRDCLELYENFAEYEQKQCTYDMITRVLGVQLACYNNLQVIYMKLKQYRDCETAATKAIELFMEPFDIYKHQEVNGAAKQGDNNVIYQDEDNITSPISPDADLPHTSRVSAPVHESTLASSLKQILNQEETEALFKDNVVVDRTLPLYGEDVEHAIESSIGPNLPGGSQLEEDLQLGTTGVPQLHTRAVLIGKTFPKQTSTNNIFKTFYRKAQALVLLGDEQGAKHYITLCQRIFNEKPAFVAWKDDLGDEFAILNTEPQTDEEIEKAKKAPIPQYKSQPVLMYNILPLALPNEDNIDNLFPICFDTVTEDIKKEVDKLQVIVDKKLKASSQRSKAQWAKAFENDD